MFLFRAGVNRPIGLLVAHGLLHPLAYFYHYAQRKSRGRMELMFNGCEEFGANPNGEGYSVIYNLTMPLAKWSGEEKKVISGNAVITPKTNIGKEHSYLTFNNAVIRKMASRQGSNAMLTAYNGIRKMPLYRNWRHDAFYTPLTPYTPYIHPYGFLKKKFLKIFFNELSKGSICAVYGCMPLAHLKIGVMTTFSRTPILTA